MNKELLQQLMNLADKYAGTEDDSLSPKRLALETAIRAAIAQPATNPWDEHVAPQMAKLASRIATHNVAPPADQTLIAPAIPGIRGHRPFVALVAQSTSQWMMTAPDDPTLDKSRTEFWANQMGLTVIPLYTQGAPAQAALETDWLQAGSLIYRLNDDPRQSNCDEINVTMADGKRDYEALKARAGQILRLLTTTPTEGSQST